MQSQKNATRESGGNECEIAWQATGIVGNRKAWRHRLGARRYYKNERIPENVKLLQEPASLHYETCGILRICVFQAKKLMNKE